MAWEGPETSPPFLRVPGPLFLKHVSLCPPPASMLVALTSTRMDVKFNALSTAPSCPVPESTWAKDLSLVTLLKIWGGSRGVCGSCNCTRPSSIYLSFPSFPSPLCGGAGKVSVFLHTTQRCFGSGLCRIPASSLGPQTVKVFLVIKSGTEFWWTTLNDSVLSTCSAACESFSHTPSSRPSSNPPPPPLGVLLLHFIDGKTRAP